MVAAVKRFAAKIKKEIIDFIEEKKAQVPQQGVRVILYAKRPQGSMNRTRIRYSGCSASMAGSKDASKGNGNYQRSASCAGKASRQAHQMTPGTRSEMRQRREGSCAPMACQY